MWLYKIKSKIKSEHYIWHIDLNYEMFSEMTNILMNCNQMSSHYRDAASPPTCVSYWWTLEFVIQLGDGQYVQNQSQGIFLISSLLFYNLFCSERRFLQFKKTQRVNNNNNSFICLVSDNTSLRRISLVLVSSVTFSLLRGLFKSNLILVFSKPVTVYVYWSIWKL